MIRNEDSRQLVLTRSFRVSIEDVWASASQQDGTTELQLVQYIDDELAVSEVGRAWEYCLDMLVAS